MSRTKSITLSTKTEESWEAALTDAEKQVREVEEKRKRLKETIAAIKRKINAAEPWPGAGVQELDGKRQANG